MNQEKVIVYETNESPISPIKFLVLKGHRAFQYQYNIKMIIDSQKLSKRFIYSWEKISSEADGL